MVINENPKEDVEAIKSHLFTMLSDRKKLLDIRDKAWQTAKTRSFERRAYAYQKLYRKVSFPDEQPVSVVVPIYDKPEIIRKCLNAIADQTYKNIEIVVADDNVNEQNNALVYDFSRYVSIPVRYLATGNGDYGLARARNEATIEATGEIMVYCDQRMILEPNAIEEFIKYLPADKTWLYGNKGAKKEFVENFSCIRRSDIIDAGLFNERINAYGGMSQECRTRFRNQGGRTVYVESAKAIPTGKSSNRNQKRLDIIHMKNRLSKMWEL
jgi:GT2 family glycosyltransferase